MKNLKKPARLSRKAPSNQTGGTAWGKKLAAEFSRMAQSADMKKLILLNFGLAYKSALPSFHPFDLLVGFLGAAALKAVIYFKGKNAKKYRQGEEYGSARWSA